LATRPVVAYPQASILLKEQGLEPAAQNRTLRGIADAMAVHEIP
jgi:hypothetical protein